MPVEPSDPLAGALVADRTAPLTAQLERYATGFFARFDHFGRGIGDGSSPLLDALTARWTLPDSLDGGIELFDLDGFAELSRAWSSRSGYFDAAFDADTPHIVPIDDAEPTPLDAREIRRVRPAPPAGAMRPVAPPRVMRFSGSDPGAPTLVEPVATPGSGFEGEGLDDRRSSAPSVATATPGATRAETRQPDARQPAPDRGRAGAQSSPAVSDRPGSARADSPRGESRISSGEDSALQPLGSAPRGGDRATDRSDAARVDARRSATAAANARAGETPAAPRADAAGVRADIAQPASADAATAAGVGRDPSPRDAQATPTGGFAPSADRDVAARADAPLARADEGATTRSTTRVAGDEPAGVPPPGRAVLPRATLARERWRAVDGQHISPYPAAMGRAGALDAGMVRFPEARARIGGRLPGVIAGPPSLDLMADGQGLTPATRGAERLIQALVERLVPTGADPVSSWLLPLLPTLGQSAEAVTTLLDGVLVAPVADGAAERPQPTPRADRRPLPDAVTGVGRPRADGRLAMPRIGRFFDPTTAAAGPAPSIGLRAPALDGADGLYGGPLGETGALVEPVADGVSADAVDSAPIVTRSRPGAAERYAAAAPVVGDARPRVGPSMAAGQPAIGPSAAAERVAIGTTRTPQPSADRMTPPGPTARPVERRPLPRDGARAWMMAALENPAGAATSPASPFGGPGAVGAASRALAERLAVAMGEVPLLAPSPATPTFGRLLDGAPDAAVVAPSADRAPDALAPAEATRAADAADPAGTERAEAKPESAAITGQTGRAAAQWAARIGDRLAGSAAPVAEPAVAGVVARIEQRLIEGAPGLVDALRRFEAADEPVAGARAWRVVIAEAGLDPQTAELIAPVADEPAPMDPEGRAQRAAAPGATATGAAATQVTADRAPATAASQASSAPPGAVPRPSTPARTPIGARPMAAAARSRHPLAASGPSIFEQRMGRLPGARAAGPAEQSRWVLDPAGRRWLVPLSAPAPANTASTAAPSRRAAELAAATLGDPFRPSYVARRQAAVQALAERIDAAMNPPAAEPGSMARVLSRLSPAHQQAWISSGFDLDRLPPTERAAIGAMIAPAAGQPEISRPSSSAPVAAGAAPVELPIASAARMMARSLARPGALGAALSGLAGRIEARPDRALRRDGAAGRPAGGSPSVGPTTDGASREMASAEGQAEPGALVSAESGAQRPPRRQPVASSMDPSALLASGTSAAESRMPARLARLWAAATGVEPTPSAAPAFEADTPRVVVEPGGGEASGGESSPGSDFGGSSSATSGSARASLPGGRTAEAALRAFDRARAGDRTRASALGRPAVSGDIGQLLTTLGAESPGGQLFGDRGPVAITPPTAGRVFIETGSQAAGSQPLRSAGESPGRQVETNEQARHRNAEQIEGDMSPEELERLAEQVIERLRQEAEFDSARFGADEWD